MPLNNIFEPPIPQGDKKSFSEMKPDKYGSYIEKIMDEMRQSRINETSNRTPNLSKSVDDKSLLQRKPESILPKIHQKYVSQKNYDQENERIREDIDVLLRSSEKFNRSFIQKSPHKVNEIKGINYNFVNRNRKDDVKGLLFMDKAYNNPVEKVYEDIDNPLKINKKDYIESISNPKSNFSKMTFGQNDISSYEILKKKMVTYIHFNIHKESHDEQIMEKANRVRECEEKKFLMSKVISDQRTKEKYNAALEKRILALFDEVSFLFLISFFFFFRTEKKDLLICLIMSIIINKSKKGIESYFDFKLNMKT